MAISFLQQFDTSLKTVLYDKFKDLLGLERDPDDIAENINIGVIQTPKNLAVRWHAEKLDQDSLEFVSMWRNTMEFAWTRQKTAVAQRGLDVVDPLDPEVVYNIKAIPVNLTYDVHLWSLNLDTIYKCLERYAFWQHENPQFSITYGDAMTIRPDIHFGTMVDESTVPEEFEKGVVFCYRIPISVDAWLLQDADESGILINKIETTIYNSQESGYVYESVLGDPPNDPELEAVMRTQRSELYGIWSTASPNIINLYKDYTSDFTPGDLILVVDSANNSGRFIVNNVSTVSEATVITVDEDVVLSTGAMGYVYKLA